MVLHTTYFGSIDWYRQIACAKEEVVYIEAHENYIKQTERNRCYIATANGKQALSVPVTLISNKGPNQGVRPLDFRFVRNKSKVSEVLVSDHGNWRHNHWEALKSAYGMSPFFDFYQDDIHPFFTERWESLFDFNLAIAQKMLELLGITKKLQPTTSYQGASQLRTLPSSQAQAQSGTGAGGTYYQTFARRNGFIPGLSILDLLFNEGPEAIKYIIP